MFKLNRNILIGLIFVMVLLLGLLDFATGFELAFSFFYLIPIGIATWYLGNKEGFLFALISSFTWAASNIRKTDFVARMGGDEFALLFPNTDENGARFILGKIKETLTAKMKELNFHVTFSFGVVTFLAPDGFADAILNKADKLMYAAKESGKDRVIYQTIE